MDFDDMEIFESKFFSLEELLGEITKHVDLVKPKKSQSMSDDSSNAVESLFETSLSLANDSPEGKEVTIRHFNTLFGESSNFQGLLQVTLQIRKLISGEHMPKAKDIYEEMKEMVEEGLSETPLKNAKRYVDKFDDLAKFSHFELIYILAIYYSIGCLYVNRADPGDNLKGMEYFEKYFQSAKFLLHENLPAALIIVQQSLHALGLSYKNQEEFHKGRIHLEAEIRLIDYIHNLCKEGKLFPCRKITFSRCYSSAYGVLKRTHQALDNKMEEDRYANLEELSEKGFSDDKSFFEDDLNEIFGVWTNPEGESSVETVMDTKKKNGEDSKKDNKVTKIEKVKVKDSFEEKMLLERHYETFSGAGEKATPFSKIFISQEELKKMEKELEEKVNKVLSGSRYDMNTYRFTTEAFDPCRFLQQLNLELLDKKDFQIAAQKLYRFWRNFLHPLVKAKE